MWLQATWQVGILYIYTYIYFLDILDCRYCGLNWKSLKSKLRFYYHNNLVVLASYDKNNIRKKKVYTELEKLYGSVVVVAVKVVTTLTLGRPYKWKHFRNPCRFCFGFRTWVLCTCINYRDTRDSPNKGWGPCHFVCVKSLINPHGSKFCVCDPEVASLVFLDNYSIYIYIKKITVLSFIAISMIV